MKLSLCTIFKNEQRFLPEFLSEHNGLECQLVLVDTGSTDQSLSICKAFNIQPLHFVWEDDFSKAKNFAIDHADGQWILFLDADERIPKLKLQQLINQLETLQAQAYRIELRSTRDENWRSLTPNLESIQWHVRLFRNQSAFRYRHAIHENIVESLEENKALIQDLEDIQIFHLGYMDELIEAKVQRNIPMIETAYKQNPMDPRNLLYMAKLKRNEPNLFWYYLEQAYENRHKGYLMDVYEEAFHYILDCADHSNYMIWEARLLNLEPNHPSPALFKARQAFKEQNLDSAMAYYEKVEANLRFFMHGNYHGEVYLKLALLNAIQSNLNKALKYLDLENQWAQPNIESWFLRLKLLFSLRRAQDFVSVLKEFPPNLAQLDKRRSDELIHYVNMLEFPSKNKVLQKFKDACIK